MPPKKIKDMQAELLSSTTTTPSSVCTQPSSSTTASNNAAPAKSSSTSSGVVVKASPGDSDRLQFAQAINNLVAKSDAIVAVLQEIQTFDRDRIQNIDMKLEAKKKEYADMTASLSSQYEQLQKQLENEFIDAKIKCNQDIRENGLTAANNLLAGMNMSSIQVEKLNSMVTELTTLKETHAKEMQKALTEATNTAEKALERELNGLKLEHKATIASLQAQVEQQVKEIRVLNETISGLKHELSEQRNLTKEVAQASSKSQISQNFGNK
jgi:urease gamma subunit